MNRTAKITLVSALVAATGLATVGATAGWHERRGPCGGFEQEADPAMMKKQKGQADRFRDRDLNLTADEAKTLVEARLIMRGNDRLKVGQVTEKDEESYLVDIVTVDNSLVRQVEVDRDNGLPRRRFGPRR
jgi:hypothetical protein